MHGSEEGGLMLNLKNLAKSFGGRQVLHNVSLSCGRKGIIAIMGSSGIGKTTLLNIIAGIESPDEGMVENSFAHVSYKFQEPRLLPWLTALENVKLVISDKAKAERQAVCSLAEVGLAECIHQYPDQLSGGMQQRVALARALTCGGDLLLLDEPFSAVDEETKKSLLALVKQYGESHAVLLVTHDKAEAEALGATVIEL